MRQLLLLLLLLSLTLPYKVQGQSSCYRVLRTQCPAETIQFCTYNSSQCVNVSTQNTQTYDIYKWEQKRIDWAYVS
jgi:hypothetical protein